MPRILQALPLALEAARAGQNASQFGRYLQALGMGARASEVRALYKHAVEIVNGKQRNEPFGPEHFIPQGPYEGWPVKHGSGVVQYVQLLYRDKTTGEIMKTVYGVHSQAGVTRAEAKAQAIAAYADAAERYNQDLIGAVHASVYQKIPFKAAA